jgi:hypothetical protein
MAIVKLLHWFKTRHNINKIARHMDTNHVRATKASERWHEPTTRRNIQTHLLSIGFKKSKRAKLLSDFMLKFYDRFEKDGFKVMDEFLEKHKSTITKTELIFELKNAQQRISAFVRDINKHKLPKTQTYNGVKAGINNLSHGPIAYIDLVIDHLEGND